MKRFFLLTILLAAFALVLSSCGGGSAKTDVKEKETSEKKEQTQTKTVTEEKTQTETVKETQASPQEKTGWSREKKEYSWQKTYAKVLPDGNLEWAPEPFVFEKGDSIRYIDFKDGNDSNDGTSKSTAWKHHPWDSAASGKAKACTGIHTYVFKGGVEYRGALTVAESGTKDNPIRLTKDPSWGNGNPIFSGSTVISSGWKKADASTAPGIPEPEKVWFKDVGKDYDKDPGLASFTAIWQVDGEDVQRLHLARTPDYDPTDPNRPHKNWPSFSKVDGKKKIFQSPVIKKLKGTSQDELRDVVFWCTYPSLMGSAYPRYPGKGPWDLDKGTVKTGAFGSPGDWQKHRAWNHFMIENAAVLLDADGEYFYARRGKNAGRLFVRPYGGIDPNSVRYEVAQRKEFIGMMDKNNIVISGLEFRYNDGDDGQPKDNSRHNTKASHCILIRGSALNITIKNNTFTDIADAVEARLHKGHFNGESGGNVMDNIIICDNDIKNASGAGIISVMGPHKHPVFKKTTKYGWLKHVEVLRNRLVNTGFRGSNARWDSLPAIDVSFPETCEIAGNIVKRSMGIGIITHGGKSSGFAERTVPLIRYLIHHNLLDQTMLDANDYGGLEHFQGGPTYFYSNVSRNCMGNRSFWNQMLGYNLYLDGGFKCYIFNNILAGEVRKNEPDFYNHCGYFMVFGFLDQFFNNTVYHFLNGIDGSSGNRSNVVGNLISDCKENFFRQNRPGDHSMMGGGDTGEMGRMGIPTMAYSSNVFYGSPETFGQVAGTTKPGQRKAPVVKGNNLEEMQRTLAENNCRLSDVGVQVDKAPLAAPAAFDYRPASDSGVKGHGVKYFVPWSLARMVGEWNFYKSGSVPDAVLDEHFYMTDEYLNRRQYYNLPRMDLTVSGCSADDYVSGPLEDWIDGALSFDGSRVAVLTNAEMRKDMEYAVGKSKVKYEGSKRETVDMDTNNFLIEIYFKTEAGSTGGTLVSKTDGVSGYELKIGSDGKAVLTLMSGSNKGEVSSVSLLNDGKWHHLVVEADRSAAQAVFYVDGMRAGRGGLGAVASGASLSNAADFIVGKGLKGAVDFLRVCRATLAESKTDIDELYAWEFNGPQLKDFAGTERGETFDAGAIQGK